MTQKIQPHTDEELKLSFEQTGCPSQFFQKFKDVYLKLFDEFCEDGVAVDESELEYLKETKNDALWLTLEKIKRFLKEINFGHCEEWASLIISSALYYNEREYCDCIHHAYDELSEIDKELADREIQIHSKTFGEDELFEKHFVSLIVDYQFYGNIIETAKKYSKDYKRLIKEGKSPIYAHHYADRSAFCDDTDLYCEKYAYAAERALSQGLNEVQARIIADEFGEYICNNHTIFYCDKYFEYLMENVKYLSKFLNDLPNEITRGQMENLIVSLTEEQLADFVLDTVIAHKKNKNCQNNQTSDVVEEKIDLNKEDDSYDSEKDLIDDYKKYKQNRQYKQAESKYDAIWDSMFPEGDDDDSITDYLTR